MINHSPGPIGVSLRLKNSLNLETTPHFGSLKDGVSRRGMQLGMKLDDFLAELASFCRESRVSRQELARGGLEEVPHGGPNSSCWL